jgi:hypothetical protein
MLSKWLSFELSLCLAAARLSNETIWFYDYESLVVRRLAMTESEIWQIIQTGNEISVMRIEVFTTITAAVLIVSSIKAIRLNIGLLCILLSSYVVFGYINFSMIINEMEILGRGMIQLRTMVVEGKDVSLMGQYLAKLTEFPMFGATIPAIQASYWAVTVSTVAYSIWRYVRQSPEV